MSLFASLAPPSFLRRRLARAVGRGGPLPLERRSSRVRARLGGRRFALLLTAALVNTVCVGTAWRHLQRRKLQSFGARTGADISTEFPRKLLRQHLCAQAAASCSRGACGGSMQLGASEQGNTIFSAMTAPVYCDGPEREHGAAMSGGRKKRHRLRLQRRTSSTVIISAACLSRACVGAASLACSTS